MDDIVAYCIFGYLLVISLYLTWNVIYLKQENKRIKDDALRQRIHDSHVIDTMRYRIGDLERYHDYDIGSSYFRLGYGEYIADDNRTHTYPVKCKYCGRDFEMSYGSGICPSCGSPINISSSIKVWTHG